MQVLEPTALHDDGFAYLTLLNPTGGLVGGDSLQADIILDSGSRVCLTTPSATKVYRTLGPAAVVDTAIHVGVDAILEYVPDHVIPYPGSALHQRLLIDLAEGSCAFVYDAFAIGRVARGEKWRFKEFFNEVAVTLKGWPIFVDRFALGSSVSGLSGIGGTPRFNYSAMFGLFAANLLAPSKLTSRLQKELGKNTSVASGVSLLADSGCVVRMLARSAIELNDVLRRVWAAAREELLSLSFCDLRKL
jgi:urease accessory protein